MMTAPQNHLRKLREVREQRRLQLARLLRENPDLTNGDLSKALNVNRDTIAEDRKALMEQLTKNTLNETEQLREEMCGRLQKLNDELELHRRDGKLPVSVIHEMLLVHRSVIELLGVRKPVDEFQPKLPGPLMQFQTVIVRGDGSQTRTLQGTLVKVLKGDQGDQIER
jgi:hypothetical protein